MFVGNFCPPVDPDTDPGTPLNPDPDTDPNQQQHWFLIFHCQVLLVIFSYLDDISLYAVGACACIYNVYGTLLLGSQ
jgi:hypothetical protein